MHLLRAYTGCTKYSSGMATRCLSCSGSLPLAPRAAMLVIGNEILNGSVTDANTPWLAKLLWSRGVDLCRVEFVPDEEGDIINSIHRLKDKVGPDGFVFTSGGIGPTHDDITYACLAKAFNVDLEYHAHTVSRMTEHYAQRNVELNASRLRMALLPTPADKVLFTPGLWVPLVVLHSVYILPGIPRLFQAMIEANKDAFQGPAAHVMSLYSTAGEGDIAEPLTALAKNCPTVRIGSYPRVEEKSKSFDHTVKLTFESRDSEALDAAIRKAKKVLPNIVTTTA